MLHLLKSLAATALPRTPLLRWPLSERCRQSLDVGSHGFRRTELSPGHASLQTPSVRQPDCQRNQGRGHLLLGNPCEKSDRPRLTHFFGWLVDVPFLLDTPIL